MTIYFPDGSVENLMMDNHVSKEIKGIELKPDEVFY